MSLPARVLSIQSHVVAGCVGNKAAVFPLQLLGFEVDAINTVQFSNHTGYPTWRGKVLNGEELWSLIEGLEANGLLAQYTHLLTGFIGSLSLLHTVQRVLLKLRQFNPDLVYVCDPVQGDNGQLYVSPELPPAFASELVPIATIMTPNQFETELLTGRSIHSVADALLACRSLHARGPHTVVITSLDLDPEHVTLVASTTKDQEGAVLSCFSIRVPRLQAYLTGTGDLFSALLLGRLHRTPANMQTAVELALAGLQEVLRASGKDRFEIKADLPGVKKEDINITTEGDVLSFSVQASQEKRDEDPDTKYHRFERSSAFVSRSVRLPQNADLSAVTASYKDGVLHLEVPKCEERAQPRKITIN